MVAGGLQRKPEAPWRERRLRKLGPNHMRRLEYGIQRATLCHLVPVSALAALVFMACGGRVAGDMSSTTGTHPESSCASDEYCPQGVCFEQPDRARICAYRPKPNLVECPALDQACCANDSECADEEHCVAARYSAPGDPPGLMTPTNRCQRDACQVDADCSGALCVPPGAYGFSTAECVEASCRWDSDCTREAQGRCVLMQTMLVEQFYCSYPADACQSDSDCDVANSMRCMPLPDGHGAECQLVFF